MKFQFAVLVAFLSLIGCCCYGQQTANEDDENAVYEEPLEFDVKYDSPQIPIEHQSKVYLAEHFDSSSDFTKRWILSKTKKANVDGDIAQYDGEWRTEPAIKDALHGDSGLVLKTKAKHAAIGAMLGKPFRFSGADRSLIVQYEVAFQNGQDCGGAYMKLLVDGVNLKEFHDKTPYSVMFGPDKCGNDHKLHFIFNHKNPRNGSIEEKHCSKPKGRLEEYFTDKRPHLYTLTMRPDNTFSVAVDKSVVLSGSLLTEFTPPVNPPAEIDDPNDTKPADWDEREKIEDANAVKPDDWDEDAPERIVDESAHMPDGWLPDEPSHVPDQDATMPADWDSDTDGEWEPPVVPNPKCADAPGCGEWETPLISNPAYKGKWRRPLINNPNYKGKWSPRKIPNPHYFEDKQPFQRMQPISAVGFELWSMSENIYIDNVIITDDESIAQNWAAATFDIKMQKITKDSESVIQKIAAVTNEYPALWLVYILVLGIPTGFILYFCCKPSSAARQEKEELMKTAQRKKTDAPQPDDKCAADSKEALEPTDAAEAEEELDKVMDDDVEKISNPDSEEDEEEEAGEDTEDDNKVDDVTHPLVTNGNEEQVKDKVVSETNNSSSQKDGGDTKVTGTENATRKRKVRRD